MSKDNIPWTIATQKRNTGSSSNVERKPNDARVHELEQGGKAFSPKPFGAAAIAEKVREVRAALGRQGQSAVTPVTADAAGGH